MDDITPEPLFTNDGIVFSLLIVVLGLIFFTSQLQNKFWKTFYKYIPALLLCYFLPAILNSLGIISEHWDEVQPDGTVEEKSSQLYYFASRFLLPASLVLLTLSIDLKAIANLGWKALVMFFVGTLGIVIGGPIAILIVSLISPETLAGAGPDAIWRGLSTLAGSWIGGGANQAAMLEIFEYNDDKYGAMVLVDIVVANVWMAILLFGIGQSKAIDRWLKADNSAIEDLKKRVQDYEKLVSRKSTLADVMSILAIGFTGVLLGHWLSGIISEVLVSNFEVFSDKSSALSSFSSEFFWLITIATAFGIILSFTKFKRYEGVGASKFGSVFIYILVATIGMKMDLTTVTENPGLIAIGFIWMTIHALMLIFAAKVIKAPYFFMAVGSQANVGGAASAPVVASAFHPSLTSVGVLLAVFGYAVGTYAAIACTILMEIASN